MQLNDTYASAKVTAYFISHLVQTQPEILYKYYIVYQWFCQGWYPLQIKVLYTNTLHTYSAIEVRRFLLRT